MTTAVPIVSDTATAGEAEAFVRENAGDLTSINYIYIASVDGCLSGVLSIKELFRLPSNTPLTSYTERQMITARPHTDQEHVAQLALKHNIKAIPIVSKKGELLGVVPSDVILDILSREHTEDVLRFAGVDHEVGGPDMLLDAPPLTHVRSRLPWLIVGLLGGLVAAVVVSMFEGTLTDQLILAAFIPAIVYMADAVGAQAQMLFIRALAIDRDLVLRTYLAREFVVNILLAFVLSALIFILSYSWIGSPVIPVILGITIFLTVCFTVLVAVLLPWTLQQRGHDPATASGPIATVIRDIASLFIYFGVASIFLM
jgi:magnesium transporter